MARLTPGSSGAYMSRSATPITGPPFTFACWFKPLATGSDATVFELVNSGANSNYYELFMRSTSRVLNFWNSGSTGGANGTTVLTLGTWYHVCCLTSGITDRKIYLNGVLEASSVTSVANPASQNTISLGQDVGSGSQAVNAQFAAAGFWAAALATTDIAALAAGALPPQINRLNLKCDWPLDGVFSPEPDMTGNGYSLTLNGTGVVYADGPPIKPRSQRKARANTLAPPASTNGNASGAIGTITLTAPAGAATGDGQATGTIGTITLTAPAGTATNVENATGAIGTITLTAPAGSATGNGGASGAIGTVTMTAPAGGATGTAAATGAIGTITLTAPSGTASGGAVNGNASGAIGTITLSAPTGSATGNAGASGAIGTLTWTAPNGGATGGTSGSATGAIGTITLTAPAGGAVGQQNGNASGVIGTITFTAPTGVADNGVSHASVSITASAVTPTIGVLAP